MELMREADNNDITDSNDVTACCSHDYKPTGGMYVCLCFILSSYLSVCRVSTLILSQHVMFVYVKDECYHLLIT